MSKIKIVDLFAGLGGIRLGFEKAFKKINVQTVLSSDNDKKACLTYKENFDQDAFSDITTIKAKDVPDCDVVMGGFPCQSFSIAGKRKGFEDTRGTLFFEMARIIKEKKPKVIFLENVKGLTNHDKGNTFKVILETLNELGYEVYYKILNAKDYGLPQKRERIYIVGFHREKVKNHKNFKFPEPLKTKSTINSILEPNVPINHFISERYWNTLKAHKTRHAKKGNGFGYQIIPTNETANTIVVGGMGRERNLVIDKSKPTGTSDKLINKENVRTMTVREWARLQGFPDSYKFPVSNSQAYKQLGNSVAVNVIEAVAKSIKEILKDK